MATVAIVSFLTMMKGISMAPLSVWERRAAFYRTLHEHRNIHGKSDEGIETTL